MPSLTPLADLRLGRPACVTLGSFDGVHLGHQAVIRQMVTAAHATRRQAVVITFYPHPSVVLRGRRPSFYLSTPAERAARLTALGVDASVTLPFDQDLAQIRAQAFVHQLITLARMSELWCGAEFALGYQREGTVPFLRALGETQGFTVRVLPPVTMDGEAISSTRIRQALRDGAVAQARRYLGAPYSLPGRVTRGKQRGRQIGFPTANLAIWEERAVPAVGVYACQAHHDQHVSAAVVNIGLRPTFETGTTVPAIEAHLLDFSGDLYATDLTLDFIDRLRPEMKFSGPAALRAQIEQDLVAARALLAAAPYQP